MTSTSVQSRPGNQTAFFSRREQLAADVRTTIAAIRADCEGRPDPRWLEQIIRARRLRGRIFNAALFADPAWDMLLELYAAEIAQRRVSVSSLCIASNCPGTTALRYIESLSVDGLITKENDPLDGRRRFVRLTRDGVARMDSYMNSLPRGLQSL